MEAVKKELECKVSKCLPGSEAKKETLAKVFSCEFCEVSKNTFFHRTPPVAACVIFIAKINQLSLFSAFFSIMQEKSIR